MSDMEFENKTRSLAQGMEYPRTPNIAGSVTTRLSITTRPRFSSKALAWSLTIILVLFSSLMLIPPARAAILEFIQIGIVRIFPQHRPLNRSLLLPQNPLPQRRQHLLQIHPT